MEETKPRGKPRGMRRDRDCRACKTRGIKCDLNRPRCQPCVASELPCGGYPQRVVWANKTSPTSVAATTKPKRRKPDTRNVTGRTPAARPAVVAVIADRTAGTHVGPVHEEKQSTTGPDHYSLIKRLSSFCRHIEALAGSSGARRQLSEATMTRLVSRINDLVQARMGTAPMQATVSGTAGPLDYIAALMDLSEALETANPVAFVAIAAFAFFEVCEGAFGEWQRHLYGARSLLDLHCRTTGELEVLARDVTGLSEMVSHLLWFDVMGAIIRGTTGLIFEDWHRETLNAGGFFDIVGCPASTFHVFTNVAVGGVDADPIGSCLMVMDSLLQLEGCDTDVARTADAYRCAAAIAVLARLEDAETRLPPPGMETAMTKAVDRLCHVMEMMPVSSRYYLHLAVAVFLAGMRVTRREQCDIVRRYWQNCRAAEFPRYPDAEMRCEEHWRAIGLL